MSSSDVIRNQIRSYSKGDLLYFVIDHCNVGRPGIRAGFYEGFDSISRNQINYRSPTNDKLCTVPIDWIIDFRRLRIASQIERDLEKAKEKIERSKRK